MTLLKEIIIPYLDDPYVLKHVLKGPAILEHKGNVFFGRSRTKMYDALFYCLKQVHSQEIQNFLDQEFETRINNGHWIGNVGSNSNNSLKNTTNN